MKRPLLWVGLLLACLLGASGLYVWHKAMPYDEVVDRGPSPEALGNPYLAAEHFLRQQGLAVERASGLERLSDLPPKAPQPVAAGRTRQHDPAPGGSTAGLGKVRWPPAGGGRSAVG